MTRDELIAATMQAHLDCPAGSWMHSPAERARFVSEPAWQEMERLHQHIAALMKEKGFAA